MTANKSSDPMVFFLSLLHFSEASEVMKQMNSVTHSSIKCLASKEILRCGSIESFMILEMLDKGRNSSCLESSEFSEWSDIINYFGLKKLILDETWFHVPTLVPHHRQKIGWIVDYGFVSRDRLVGIGSCLVSSVLEEMKS